MNMNIDQMRYHGPGWTAHRSSECPDHDDCEQHENWMVWGPSAAYPDWSGHVTGKPRGHWAASWDVGCDERPDGFDGDYQNAASFEVVTDLCRGFDPDVTAAFEEAL